MVSSCPTRMTPEEPRPLASMMAEVDVPYLAARPETVSPPATVCCTDSEGSEDFEDSEDFEAWCPAPEEPRPLASRMPAGGVPYLAARPETVSPAATVCCAGSEASEDSEDSEDFEDVCPPLEELEPPELLELDPLPGICTVWPT